MFELSRSEFIELHNAIIQKHKKEKNPQNLKVEKLYGFEADKNKREKKSIRNSMIEIIDMKNIFKKDVAKFSGKYLYLKYKEAQKEGNTNIKLEQSYVDVFLAYLEVKDFQHFKQILSEKIIYTKYSLLHYSIKYYGVREATLWIDYTKTPFLVKEQGFHLNEKNDNNPIYEGKAQQKKNCLYINLEDQEGDELKLIIAIPDNSDNRPQNFPFLRGVLMGVANSDLHPMAVECILIRQNDEQDIEVLKNNKIYAERYLILKRGIFRVSTEPINSLRQIQAKNKSVTGIFHMIGKYRAWSYSRQGDIEQAVFTIEPDYRAYLELDIKAGKIDRQACLLNLHSDIDQKLLVTSHAEGTINIYTYSIIDIPALKHEFTSGVFVTVGVGIHPPIATYMVLYKEKDDTEIKPRTIKKEECAIEFKKNSKLYELKKKLDRLMTDNKILWDEMDKEFYELARERNEAEYKSDFPF